MSPKQAELHFKEIHILFGFLRGNGIAREFQCQTVK